MIAQESRKSKRFPRIFSENAEICAKRAQPAGIGESFERGEESGQTLTNQAIKGIIARIVCFN